MYDMELILSKSCTKTRGVAPRAGSLSVILLLFVDGSKNGSEGFFNKFYSDEMDHSMTLEMKDRKEKTLATITMDDGEETRSKEDVTLTMDDEGSSCDDEEPVRAS